MPSLNIALSLRLAQQQQPPGRRARACTRAKDGSHDWRRCAWCKYQLRVTANRQRL